MFIKSLICMFLFFLLIKFINYIIKFIYFYKKNTSVNVDDNLSNEKINSNLSMLQCETCKVYIIKSEAYFHKGKVFCKKEHAID